MAKNLFIISSPFQLFNALEAKNRFHSNDENILLFINTGVEKNKQQIEFILQKNSFDAFHKFDYFTFKNKLFTINKLNFLLDSLGKIDHLYVALFRNISAHCINYSKPKKVLILDDGNRTLRVVKDFFSKNKKNEYKRFFDALFFKKTDLSFIYDATFFSIYKEIENSVPHFIYNDYSFMRTLNQNLLIKNQTFIIGSKLIGETLSEKNFRKIIARMCENDTCEKFYLPHRHEDIDYLEKLAKEYNFQILSLPTILEYSLFSLGYRPKVLYSIRSTAADTLHQLYQIPVTIFKPNLSMIPLDKRKELELVYNHYQSQHYQMVEIE